MPITNKPPNSVNNKRHVPSRSCPRCGMRTISNANSLALTIRNAGLAPHPTDDATAAAAPRVRSGDVGLMAPTRSAMHAACTTLNWFARRRMPTRIRPPTTPISDKKKDVVKYEIYLRNENVTTSFWKIHPSFCQIPQKLDCCCRSPMKHVSASHRYFNCFRYPQRYRSLPLLFTSKTSWPAHNRVTLSLPFRKRSYFSVFLFFRYLATFVNSHILIGSGVNEQLRRIETFRLLCLRDFEVDLPCLPNSEVVVIVVDLQTCEAAVILFYETCGYR